MAPPPAIFYRVELGLLPMPVQPWTACTHRAKRRHRTGQPTSPSSISSPISPERNLTAHRDSSWFGTATVFRFQPERQKIPDSRYFSLYRISVQKALCLEIEAR